jgi:hypothetical protein
MKNARNAHRFTRAEIARRDAEKAVRPEMIERGRKLLENPDWPDIAQARELARIIIPSLV